MFLTRSISKIVLISVAAVLVLIFVASQTSKLVKNVGSGTGKQSRTTVQGQCVAGLLSRCPVCISASEEECGRTASFESCNPITEACASTKLWTLKGHLRSVRKGCVPLSQCVDGARCTTSDDKSHRQCIACNDEKSCRELDVKLRIYSFGAGCLLTAAVVLYIIRSKRRRNCPDKCLELCVDFHRYSETDSHLPKSSPNVSSRWPQLPGYRYSVLP